MSYNFETFAIKVNSSIFKQLIVMDMGEQGSTKKHVLIV